MNETERQPGISLGLREFYLTPPIRKLATRTWQEVMDDIVAKKKDETRQPRGERGQSKTRILNASGGCVWPRHDQSQF